jgi:sec-independent protein translocase protein TatA
MLEGLFSPMHLLIILVLALIVLGPKRLPEAGRSLGEAMRGFKESIGAPADGEESPASPAPTRATISDEQGHRPAR